MLELLLIAALSHTVLGQTETDTSSGGDFTITWAAPTTYDGNLDCEATSTSCKPLNADACSEVTDPTTARAIELNLTYTSSTTIITPTSQLYIWLQKGTGSCTFDQVPELIAQHELSALDPLISNATFDFPDDLNTVIAFDTTTLLNQDDACGETALNETTYRLCFGIDLSGLTAVDNKVSATEPNGYAQFKVDTSIPTAPLEPDVTALDGRIGVALEIDDTSNGEIISQWEIWSKEATETSEDDTQSEESCTDWESTDVSVDTITGLTETSASSELSAENGKSYQICAFAIDHLGNRSSASPIVSVTPREECDFIECYPGELKTGYCGALPVLNSITWLALLSFGCFLRQRRKK
ncbi:MAG: hypothetical protein QGI45_09540 [Myxococcota bacterium]|nr:hypothetical protein [Myxococcota bacterium]